MYRAIPIRSLGCRGVCGWYLRYRPSTDGLIECHKTAQSCTPRISLSTHAQDLAFPKMVHPLYTCNEQVTEILGKSGLYCCVAKQAAHIRTVLATFVFAMNIEHFAALGFI